MHVSFQKIIIIEKKECDHYGKTHIPLKKICSYHHFFVPLQRLFKKGEPK